MNLHDMAAWTERLHRKIFAIVMYLLSIALFCLIHIGNGTVQQGADSYIVAESNGGLSNRLRALAAYLYIAEQVYNGSHTAFIWDKNSACPGHYLSIFEPVPKLLFATNSSRAVVNKHALKVYNNTMNDFQLILNYHDIDNTHPKQNYIFEKYIHPTKDIMKKVDEFVAQHNVCNMSAIHLRTTDLDKIMNHKKRTNFRIAYNFIDNRPFGEKVFLLTDDPKTQTLLMDKYGDKIVVYRKIASEAEQAQALGVNSTAALPQDHRYTSLEHTLIDVLIAAHSIHFRRSAFSSLSDLVNTFRHVGMRYRGFCRQK